MKKLMLCLVLIYTINLSADIKEQRSVKKDIGSTEIVFREYRKIFSLMINDNVKNFVMDRMEDNIITQSEAKEIIEYHLIERVNDIKSRILSQKVVEPVSYITNNKRESLTESRTDLDNNTSSTAVVSYQSQCVEPL